MRLMVKKSVIRPLHLPLVVCFIAALFYCFEYLLRISPSIMSRELMVTYHLNARSFGNLTAFYYYIYAPIQLLVGILLDRYGPRSLLTASALVCSIGIFMFANAESLFLAETGRLLIGLGSAFAFVGVLKLATIWLAPNRFAIVAGSTMALGMIGGVMGDLLLSLLRQQEGWRLTCYLLAMIGLVLAITIYLITRHRLPTPTQQFDSRPSFALLFKGFLQLIKNRFIWVNGLIGCLMYLPISGFAESWQIPFLNEAHGFSRNDAAVAAGMIFLGWAIGGPFMGWLSETIKQRRLLLTLGGSVAAIFLAATLYMPNLNHQTIFSLLFIYGLFSSSQALTFPIARELSSPMFVGMALAITNMVIMLAGFAVYLIGFLMELLWHGSSAGGLHVYSLQSYQLALLILPIGLVFAVFLTFYLPETFRDDNQD
jgi:MFS family permease